MGVLDVLGGRSRRRARSRQDVLQSLFNTDMSTFALSAEGTAPSELTGLWRAAASAPVSRDVALSVPAVVRARELVCGTLGRLPVRMHDASRNVVPCPILDQPETGIASSVTWTATYEDLFFEGVSWWMVTTWARGGAPLRAVRLDPRTCTAQKRNMVIFDGGGAVVGHREMWDEHPGLIRWESPHPPLLTVGARAIRALILLEAAAAMYADSPPAHEFFLPRDGADPASDEDIKDFLNAWKAARKTRSAAYVPYALEHKQATAMTPEQLQLIESRKSAVLEIARLTGIDPEYLGVSTTSRTYKNNVDGKHDMVDFTLASWAEAIDGRASLDDLTPAGSYVKTDFSMFLRANERERMETYRVGQEVGAWTPERVAAAEDIPAPPRAAETTPTQGGTP